MSRHLSQARRTELETALGYAFRDPRSLEEALTHASYLQRPRGRAPQGGRSYQRLEFLGDRVLGLAVAHLLIEKFPDAAEGALTQRQTALVRKESLAEVARRLELGQWLQVGSSEIDSAGGVRPTLLADSCEALIGAIYLDGGLPAARAFIERHWRPMIEAVQSVPRDAKMELQEWAQARSLETPVYRLIATSGPAHAMTFTVEVSLADQTAVTATGATKRIAERTAAQQMLQQIAAVPRD